MDWFFVQENDDRTVPRVKGAEDESCADDCLSSKPWRQWISPETKLGSSDGHCFTPAENGNKEMRTDGQTTGSFSSATYTSYHRKQSNDDISQISNASKEYVSNNDCFKQHASNMDSYDQDINVDLLSPPSSDLLFMNCEEEESSALHECGFLGEKNDYQFDDLSQNDGIFQNLVLGGNLPDYGDRLSFPYMSPTAEESSVQFENFLSDMLVDSLSLVKDSSVINGLNCFKVSPHTDNQLNVCGEGFSNQNSNHPSCSTIDFSGTIGNLPARKRQTHSASIPVDQVTFHEEEAKVEEEGSLEATVLHDLEISMERLNTKTRICFRDALYRLATSSRQQHAANQSQSSNTAVNMPANSCTNGTRESQTNAIDRTVASLLFNDMSQDSPQCLSPTHHDKKHARRIPQRKFHSKKRQNAHSLMAHNEDSQDELSLTTDTNPEVNTYGSFRRSDS